MREISFRDPSGFVYMDKEKLLRKIKIDRLNFFENLFSTSWFNELVVQKKIQKSKIVSKSKDYFIVEHEFYPFHVMPHEMCDYQLYKSALLTLDLAIEAFENNMVIKDASAWNVFFIKSNPIFCDITSFEEWDENQNWFAYGQFYRHFIIPLILSKELDIDTSKLFITNRDGFKPEDASKLLGLKKYKSLISFEGIVLPLIFNKKKIKVKKYAPNIGKKIFAQTLNRLKNYIIKLEPVKKKTTWINYETNRDHYSKQDMDDKYTFINEIAQNHFENVLDLGCNEGEYSKIFEATGSNVISTDFDNGCLNKICKSEKEKNLTVFKLDLSNPSPAIGWINKEHESFLNRMEKRFDLILCLGLIHHLQITERVPLINIIQMLENLTRKYLVIEFISNKDQKFIELAGLNIGLYKNYTQESFEQILEKKFILIKKMNFTGAKRTLYYLQIK